MPHDLNDRLVGLLALNDKTDLNMKPVMMRVITDLYTSKIGHSPDEASQFAEIAGRLIEHVDEDTLAIVAGKLARYAEPPAAVLTLLLRHGDGAARAVLEFWPGIERQHLAAAAAHGPAREAEAVARRADLDADLVALLARRSEPNIGRALVENPQVKLDEAQRRAEIQRGRSDEGLARALLAQELDAHEAAPLFIYADADMRAAILNATRSADQGRIGQFDDQPLSPALMDLERAALGRDWSRFAYWLGRCLSLSIADVRRTMADPTGQTLAVALAAAGAPSSMATRIFLCREPAISHSFAIVSGLSALVDSLTQEEAGALVDAMFGASRATPRTGGGHVPLHDPIAASTPSRPQHGQVHVRPLRGGEGGATRIAQNED